VHPRRALLLAVAGAALLAPGCRSQPTTLLVRLSAAPELPAPDELRLTVFAEQRTQRAA